MEHDTPAEFEGVPVADGGLGWTFSRAIPLKNADGEIVEWFGTASDVTRGRVEEF